MLFFPRKSENNLQIFPILIYSVANVCFGGELMQSMADLQTQLTGLQSQLQEKKGESEENEEGFSK